MQTAERELLGRRDVEGFFCEKLRHDGSSRREFFFRLWYISKFARVYVHTLRVMNVYARSHVHSESRRNIAYMTQPR